MRQLINKTKPGKWFLHLPLLLLLIGLQPGQGFAWGAKGHRIIAALAWHRLSDEAKQAVKDLLGKNMVDGDPLTAIATWADEQAHNNREEQRWHFVEIPLYAEGYSLQRDCADSNCIVEKANYFKNVLEYDGSREKRVEALKYLTHLIGDLHQPLHCADNNDYGGNRVQVTIFRQMANLHQLWDSGLIDMTNLSEESYVSKLQGMSPPRGGWMQDWANESHMIARNHAYNISKDKALGDAYYRENLPILENQLVRAGARLAWVLEGAIKGKR
jgi:hypothetical protein